MGGKFAVIFEDGFLTSKNYNIGPYNGLSIFVLFKRLMAFFKRPIQFSFVLECESF